MLLLFSVSRVTITYKSIRICWVASAYSFCVVFSFLSMFFSFFLVEITTLSHRKWARNCHFVLIFLFAWSTLRRRHGHSGTTGSIRSWETSTARTMVVLAWLVSAMACRATAILITRISVAVRITASVIVVAMIVVTEESSATRLLLLRLQFRWAVLLATGIAKMVMKILR